MFIVGMDIGYSNLKLVAGRSGQEVSAQFHPVGAAPIAHSTSPLKAGDGKNGFHVTVKGEDFVAGIEPDRLANWHRALHQDYPSTHCFLTILWDNMKYYHENNSHCCGHDF